MYIIMYTVVPGLSDNEFQAPFNIKKYSNLRSTHDNHPINDRLRLVTYSRVITVLSVIRLI